MKKIYITKKYLVFLAILSIGFLACNKQESVHTDQLVNEEIVDKSFVLNNNFADLNKRLTIVHEPILFSGNFKVPIPSDCGSYTWYLVAEVAAPIFRGEALSATDVRILGNKAYVSYHRQGSVYAGGIEVIDISDPGYPTIVSYMGFDNVDINSLAIDERGTNTERKVFLAGSSFKNGAILRQVITNNGYLNPFYRDIKLSNAFTDGSITPSANSIGLANDYLYMSAGNKVGGTFQLNRQSLAILANEAYSDAKAIGLNGVNNGDYQVTLIGGDNAKLNVYRVGTDRTLVRSIPLGSIIHQKVAEPYLGKATVTIRNGEKIAFIAMNSGGMKAVNIETGAVVYTSPSNMLTTGNTHGLTVDANTIYMANSDDGLFIGCIPSGGGEITMTQHWDLDEVGASANMVQTDGDWVFVAKGGGGLKILRKIQNTSEFPTVSGWDKDGRPLNIISSTLCENLLVDLEADIPAKKDIFKKHAEYFQNNNKEIVLTQDANVSVTFVSENSHYTNSFGYYTYNVNNPPNSIEDIRASMKLIFANASSVGSGGTLIAGDQLSLGNFPAGTVIGYYFVASGWNGHQVTDGLYKFYTLPRFNLNGEQQTLMLYSDNCSSLLTVFEEENLTSKDKDGKQDKEEKYKDFSDLVVKTSITPMSAMSTANVIKLPTSK